MRKMCRTCQHHSKDESWPCCAVSKRPNSDCVNEEYRLWKGEDAEEAKHEFFDEPECVWCGCFGPTEENEPCKPLSDRGRYVKGLQDRIRKLLLKTDVEVTPCGDFVFDDINALANYTSPLGDGWVLVEWQIYNGEYQFRWIKLGDRAEPTIECTFYPGPVIFKNPPK